MSHERILTGLGLGIGFGLGLLTGYQTKSYFVSRESDDERQRREQEEIYHQIRIGNRSPLSLIRDRPLITFTGPKGAGKSTAMELIRRNLQVSDSTVHHCSFAGPLKEGVTEFFGLDDECYNVQKKEEIIPRWNVSARHLLQIFGTEVCREQLTEEQKCPSCEYKRPALFPNMHLSRETLWVSRYYNEVRELQKKRPGVIVTDDCRFDDEYRCIKDLGGLVIRIVRSIDELDPTPDEETHASEAGCSYDEFIINNGSLTDLHDNLVTILLNHGYIPSEAVQGPNED